MCKGGGEFVSLGSDEWGENWCRGRGRLCVGGMDDDSVWTVQKFAVLWAVTQF